MPITLATRLEPFPATAGAPAGSVVARLERGLDELRYRLEMAVPGLRLPPAAVGGGDRRDGLWRRTCAELFVGIPGRRGYLEWNLAPSGDWNLYRFDDYRVRAGEAPPWATPDLRVEHTGDGAIIEATLPLAPFGLAAAPLELAACAVAEAADGVLSWWAARHPAERPDFHDRRGFVLRLPVAPPSGPPSREPEETP